MTVAPKVDPNIKPGIYLGTPNESYHAGPGISKSGLWTIQTQSPAHYKFGEREESHAFDFGEACHLAILQPDEFEKKVLRGPEDRRGNKWKDMVEGCALSGKLLLTGPDYDSVLAIRDGVHADSWINGIITGGKPMIEASGYWRDEETGALCRCRPDLYREDLGVMLDVKSTVSAHPDAFSKAVVNYGYHAQEAHYSDGWRANGKAVEGFVFLAWEKKAPFAKAVYELPPSIVEEGRALMRKALNTYVECEKTQTWPAYGDGVHELSFKRWAYQLTEAPGIDGEAAA
ncbi:MAG: PD-(D/E)XK nuclease-like domain-containing protein [Sphingomonas sp.]|uniref:PD-(D/E)XK nuclease-like domain-containing protein n=1 Tax=Sphingomonas sp. TaxID=28214 RepID=UPI00261DC6DC|nr:PD-(D/E)XK nuclease-like domain-containing protein [Sphingomonas sp.]MDK2769935.1 PD-(D/E)XK nuclease-like domain-containing protein [Sphingomonas sp.]